MLEFVVLVMSNIYTNFIYSVCCLAVRYTIKEVLHKFVFLFTV